MDKVPIPFPSLPPARNEAAAAPPERKGTGKDAAVQIYREILLENIEYDYLIQDNSIDREQLDEIVDLMLETVCTSRKTIRIAKEWGVETEGKDIYDLAHEMSELALLEYGKPFGLLK